MLKTGFIALALLVYTSSYAGTLPDPFQTGKIIDVTCKTDATQSYALYIPIKGNKEALPIVYCFDPHGDGALPLKKYRSLAEANGFILVGSNNSKNGNDWPSTENIWRNLSEDTKGRLKINTSRIYTCGFSGGAKVASYIAIQHTGIAGVIANGAGLPDGVTAGNFNFSFTAIGGEGDMNLTDLVAISTALDNSRTRHRIIIFDGKHEWAPENTMSLAFTGLQFDAMRDGLVPKDNAFVNRFVIKCKSRVDTYITSNQLIKAGEYGKLSMDLLEGLTPETTWFRQKQASLGANKQYQQQLQAQQQLLVTETAAKNTYMQHFQQNDPKYWNSTIGDLKTRAAAKTAEGAMYQRLLAYLSLAFYSFSNHLITGNDNSTARYFVELYKMADPTNSEAWYFSAILHAREHDIHATESDLLKAAGYGFRDKVRLVQQAEFKNQSTPLNFYKIESKMQTP